MKKAHIILAAVLSMSLTGCGTATEETTDVSSNSLETQAETEKATETETEKSAATEKITETETAEVTDAATEETTEMAAETSDKAEKNEVFALNGPLGRYQGPDEFSNATFAAAFGKDDLVKTDDGTIALTVMIYRYELFSEDDISTLKKGDVIWCLGEEVVIDTIETTENGGVIINGGIENGGRLLKTDDGGIYYEVGMNDVKSYYEIGENQYALAEGFVLTDNSDPNQSVTYTAEEFLALEHGDIGFINANTIVETNDHVITAIERVYIP